jgi:hypothetical protein
MEDVAVADDATGDGVGVVSAERTAPASGLAGTGDDFSSAAAEAGAAGATVLGTLAAGLASGCGAGSGVSRGITEPALDAVAAAAAEAIAARSGFWSIDEDFEGADCAFTVAAGVGGVGTGAGLFWGAATDGADAGALAVVGNG